MKYTVEVTIWERNEGAKGGGSRSAGKLFADSIGTPALAADTARAFIDSWEASHDEE